MTQRERYSPDDPREWLSRARSNLRKAQVATPGVFFEDLCFDAQQAAEKSIKAVMIARGIDFPYIHNIAKPLTVLEEKGEQIPPEILQAERLTRYAHETRYPGAAEPVPNQITSEQWLSPRLSLRGPKRRSSGPMLIQPELV